MGVAPMQEKTVLAGPGQLDGVAHDELQRDLFVVGRRCQWLHIFVEPVALHHPKGA